MEIQSVIDETLTETERRNNVSILYACESGSRCWGFASPDSDFDVRYIYVRREEDYLRVNPMRDVIEGPLDEVFDFSGWDLQKALKLLKKNNSALLEWLRSPITYRDNPAFREAMLSLYGTSGDLARIYASYRGMAENNIRSFLSGDSVPLKKYLYILRPLLCCEWIRERDTLPPVVFDELFNARRGRTPELDQEISSLLALKKKGLEKEKGPHYAAIDRFIETQLKADVPAESSEGISDDLLDKFFLKSIHGDFLLRS